MDLTEYKRTLLLDPQATNTGTWYARNTIQHDGRSFTAGTKLPTDLTNGHVAQLLDVNALTSVAPKKNESDVQVPPHNGAPNQTGVNADGTQHGNNQAPGLSAEQITQANAGGDVTLTDEQKAARDAELERQRLANEQGQSGNGQLDENGNPIQGA